MLLNLSSAPSAGDIIAVKLINGEEIIAKFVSAEGSKVTVSRPVILVLTPSGGGQAQVSFAPFMLGIDLDNEITIDESKMVTSPVKARNDAAKQYIQSTTGIAL
jgi:hypothetical protein